MGRDGKKKKKKPTTAALACFDEKTKRRALPTVLNQRKQLRSTAAWASRDTQRTHRALVETRGSPRCSRRCPFLRCLSPSMSSSLSKMRRAPLPRCRRWARALAEATREAPTWEPAPRGPGTTTLMWKREEKETKRERTEKRSSSSSPEKKQKSSSRANERSLDLLRPSSLLFSLPSTISSLLLFCWYKMENREREKKASGRSANERESSSPASLCCFLSSFRGRFSVAEIFSLKV